MTVEELIKRLKQFNKKTEVWRADYEYTDEYVREVEEYGATKAIIIR